MSDLARALDPPGLAARAPALRSFFGEPAPLAYLALTEVWERFSYYGMSSILVLYMEHVLLAPGRAAHVVGLHAFQTALTAVFGPLGRTALASQVFGFYGGLVYFTPVLGGLIADRWTGRRNAVLAGAALMSAGHLMMASQTWFMVALVLLIVGCGLLKGNISSQVGDLYPAGDADGRTRGFAIFSMAINTGAIGGPLLCGLLAQVFGWNVGFAAAGGLMLLGTAIYASGYRRLPGASTSARRAGRLSAGDGKLIAGLALVTAISLFQTVAYFQSFDGGMIWAERSVDMRLFGWSMPVAWLNAINPVASVLGVPVLVALWRWQAAHGHEPDAMGKIGIGAALAGVANLILALACVRGGAVSILAPIGYELVVGIAFLFYWPTLLALVSEAAPEPLKATLMGAVFLSLFVANLIVGWLGGLLDTVAPAAFWTLHAAIAAVGAISAWALRDAVKQLLAASDTGA